MRRGINKKGVSPTIATVLLIALVIVAGLLVFAWFKSFSKEAVTKFGGKNVELVCDDLDFEASYSGGILYVSNLGNVPIYSLNLKEYGSEGFEITELKDESSIWPAAGLAQGMTFSDAIEFSGATKVVAIPVLAGNSDSGQKIVPCEERNGYEVVI